MSLHRLSIVLALAAFLGWTPISPAARLDGPSINPQIQRRYVLEHMRLAASDRLIEQDDEIAVYLAAQFNTIVLYDIEDGLLKSEERINFEVTFARVHGLHILLGKPTEPFSGEVGVETARVHAAAVRVRHPLAIAAKAQVSDEEIRDRLSLWDRYGHDVILGVFFLHDDVFLIHTTIERQRHLYALAHDIVPDWAVFGMVGEFGFDATPEEAALYFDPSAFDDLLILMYPLNIGHVTGVHLDSAVSADPDEDMRRYVQRYLTRMAERFISLLTPGQLAVLVIQAFAYDVEPVGRVPRPTDIMIEAIAGNEFVRSVAGQERNRALAYFLWDGSRAGMFGLLQRPDWMSTAETANRFDRFSEERVGINP